MHCYPLVQCTHKSWPHARSFRCIHYMISSALHAHITFTKLLIRSSFYSLFEARGLIFCSNDLVSPSRGWIFSTGLMEMHTDWICFYASAGNKEHIFDYWVEVFVLSLRLEWTDRLLFGAHCSAPSFGPNSLLSKITKIRLRAMQQPVIRRLHHGVFCWCCSA